MKNNRTTYTFNQNTCITYFTGKFISKLAEQIQERDR